MKHKMTKGLIKKFRENLIENEKTEATIEKYTRDVVAFFKWLDGGEVSKQKVILYKEKIKQTYKTRSVNSMISSINSFFAFADWYDCRVKTIKVQRENFYDEEKELSKYEYEKLLKTADEKLSLIMQTICSSGIRISELKYVTAQAIRNGRCEVECKSKRRTVILPKDLCGLLYKYIEKNHIKSGSIFLSKQGKPINRGCVWASMKKLCKKAGVDPKKVFPHNLRHLFARTYYTFEKDIVRLADILGHASVNTTRIYTLESGKIHRSQLQRLGLVRMRA